MASASTYPVSLDNDANLGRVSADTPIEPPQHNNHTDALEAIEAFVGVRPGDWSDSQTVVDAIGSGVVGPAGPTGPAGAAALKVFGAFAYAGSAIALAAGAAETAVAFDTTNEAQNVMLSGGKLAVGYEGVYFVWMEFSDTGGATGSGNFQPRYVVRLHSAAGGITRDSSVLQDNVGNGISGTPSAPRPCYITAAEAAAYSDWTIEVVVSNPGSRNGTVNSGKLFVLAGVV